MTKKEKTEELRKMHQSVFDALNEPKAVFYPKVYYYSKEAEAKAVPIFPDEFSKLMGRNIYIEFVDMDHEPEIDMNGDLRTLWRWRHTTDWKKYPKSKSKSGVEMYMLPVKELEKVKSAEILFNLVPQPKLPFLSTEAGAKGRQALKDLTKAFPDEHEILGKRLVDVTLGELRSVINDLIKK